MYELGRCTTWEEQRYRAWVFPVVAECPGIEISRVHPLQQRAVVAIVNVLKKYDNVDFVVLFGSSTTLRCHGESDLDLVVKLKDPSLESRNEVSEAIQLACDWRADILWFDRIKATDSIAYDVNRGVMIYEREV